MRWIIEEGWTKSLILIAGKGRGVESAGVERGFREIMIGRLMCLLRLQHSGSTGSIHLPGKKSRAKAPRRKHHTRMREMSKKCGCKVLNLPGSMI